MMDDCTPMTSLVQQQPFSGSSANVAAAGPAGGVTSLAPASYKREEPATPPTTYVPPNVTYPAGPPPGVRAPLYPENTRLGVQGQPPPPQQQPLQPAPQQPVQYQPYNPPQQQQPRVAYGGGQEPLQNPRLDPAGEVFTHIPRIPASASHFAGSAFNQRVYQQQQAELADFHESKRLSAMYGRLFQSGLFPFLAGILFLLFTCAPAHEAVLRAFTPFGLVHESGGGLTLSGKVVQSVLFGFAFSFAVHLA